MKACDNWEKVFSWFWYGYGFTNTIIFVPFRQHCYYPMAVRSLKLLGGQSEVQKGTLLMMMNWHQKKGTFFHDYGGGGGSCPHARYGPVSHLNGLGGHYLIMLFSVVRQHSWQGSYGRGQTWRYTVTLTGLAILPFIHLHMFLRGLGGRRDWWQKYLFFVFLFFLNGSGISELRIGVHLANISDEVDNERNWGGISRLVLSFLAP